MGNEKENKSKFYIIIAIIVGLIFIDQVTKIISMSHNGELIKGVLCITTVQNRGGAFGVRTEWNDDFYYYESYCNWYYY